MPIRFACPSCRQPIEIDDQWGGQSVACPYCRNVVAAPAASTWPSSEVPMARPAGEAFAPPPPPAGSLPPLRTANGPSSAPRALAISAAGFLLALVAGIVKAIAVMRIAAERAGPSPTPEQVNKIAIDVFNQESAHPSGALVVIALATLIMSIAGLVLGIRSLARREPRRGMAVAACVLSGLFLFCQLIVPLLLRPMLQ